MKAEGIDSVAKKEMKQSALAGLTATSSDQAEETKSAPSLLTAQAAVPVHSNTTYELAFAQLETILQALEGDDLPLAESLALYEQGVVLAAHCTTLLDSAELRVRQWQNGGTTTAFNGWQEG